MEREISAANANRKFSELLRSVRDEGTTYVVTIYGKPIAKLMPTGQTDKTIAQAHSLLLRRLQTQRTTKIGKRGRDELYDG